MSAAPRSVTIPLLIALCLILAGLGLWAGEQRARAVDARLRDALLQEATEIAQTIDLDLARALTFTSADVGTQADARLRAHMVTYAGLVRWGGIYTLALRDGVLVFGPESYSSGSVYASSPGEIYQGASSEDYEVLTRAQGYVAGPSSDEYGTFVSALAPVEDPLSGEVLFAVGVDVPAGVWQEQMRQARIEPLLYAAAAILLAVAGAVAFAWRGRRPLDRQGRWRYLEAVLVFAWGLYITVIAAVIAARAETDERDHVFRKLSLSRVGSVRSELERVRHDLDALARFYEASSYVDAAEFAAFARLMVRGGAAQMYAWAPALTPGDARVWEAGVASEQPGALPPWEFGVDGEQRLSSGREVYHPIAYTEPAALGQRWLGYDLASDSSLSSALDQASRSGLKTAANPTRSEQDQGQWELWIAHAVESSVQDDGHAQQGHVLALLPMQTMLDTVLDTGQQDSGLVGMDLIYLDGQGGYTVLASYPHGHGEIHQLPGGRYAPTGQPLEQVLPLFFFGRPMALVYHPTPAYQALSPLRTTPAIGLAGLVMTASVTLLVYSVRRRAVVLERLVAERTVALAESEAHYRTLYDRAHSPIMIVDAEDRYLDANAAALAFLECARDELIGRRIWDLMPSQEAERFRAEHPPSSAPFAIEAPYLVGDRVKTLLLSVVPITQKGCTVYLGIGQDITERKESERRRLEMERQMLQSQKLESLGVLAGGIAHDFNNLLAAILGNIELAQMELSNESPAYESLCEATNATRRAADLTRQMLAYSGKGRFVLTDLDLSALVQENAHMLRVAIPRNAVLRLDLAAGLAPVRADAGQIQQIVMNLIINAAEALQQEMGVVTVATGQDQLGAEALQNSRTDEKPAPGAYVWLAVTDTGCGMSDDTLQRMFDPFFTSKMTGRGLGLSAVLGIVRGHRGAIWVQSSPGRGTSIKVAFPALPKERDAATPGAPRSVEHSLSGVILVVDDEDIVRSLCCTVLERMGLTAVPATSGEEACAIYEARHSEIDGVLLDLTMPGMDGAATLEGLHRINPKVKAILCSGFGAQAVSERLAGVGMAGFVQKPFDFATLRAALERLLSQG